RIFKQALSLTYSCFFPSLFVLNLSKLQQLSYPESRSQHLITTYEPSPLSIYFNPVHPPLLITEQSPSPVLTCPFRTRKYEDLLGRANIIFKELKTVVHLLLLKSL